MTARFAQPPCGIDDTRAFAAVSGDWNPLHVDPNVARRSPFGRPVVHGIMLVLRSLELWCEHAGAMRLRSIHVRFLAPVCVGDAFVVGFGDEDIDGPEPGIRVLGADGRPAVTIALHVQPAEEAPRFPDDRAPSAGSGPGEGGSLRPADPDFPELAGAAGFVADELDVQQLRRLYPGLALPLRQIAALACSSTLVGMHCPGLHSLYSALDLEFEDVDDAADAGLHYRVERADARFHRLQMQVHGLGARGRVTAFQRAAPVRQLSSTAAAALVSGDEFRGRRVIVIGGSRGLGEVAAKLLAAGGAEVLLTGTQAGASSDAQRVAVEIGSAGGIASALALVLPDGVDGFLAALPDAWTDVDLCFFATPPIPSQPAGAFDLSLFRALGDVYVGAPAEIVAGLYRVGRRVSTLLNPSSEFVESVPRAMGEYACAKAAAEVLCRSLETRYPGLVAQAPRWPRLATDQTASTLPQSLADAGPVVLAALRAVIGASRAQDRTVRGMPR